MPTSAQKLKVCIDFRVDDPRQGVGTAVLALLHGLGNLRQTEQEYVLLVQERHLPFFQPYVSGSCTLVGVPSSKVTPLSKLKARLRRISLLQWLWTKVRPSSAQLPVSDGTAERLGCDLVHFPSQLGYVTALPFIYQPWDLQHCHYPQFFTPQDVRARNTQYRGLCERAQAVCVQTDWTRQDVATQFRVDPEKIVVIRWGTAFDAYRQPSPEETEKVRNDRNLPGTFFLYPAVCWPHKNHAIILRALALLQARTGSAPHVVFTGAPTPYQAEVEALARQLGVSAAVHFLGFTSAGEIQALFHLAKALLFPSRFEGLGLPVLEAFRSGLPVICSTATVLPEVTAGAALLFDPDSAEELANHMEAVLASPLLGADLAQRGSKVLESYTSEAMAEHFFQLYARLASKPMAA